MKKCLQVLNSYKISICVTALLLFLFCRNTQNVQITFFVRQFTVLLFMTLAVTIEYESGLFDLAFAAQISASSLLCVWLVAHGAPIWMGLTAVVLFHAAVGALKSFLTFALRIPSIIGTLALQMILANFFAGLFGNDSFVDPSLSFIHLNYRVEVILGVMMVLGLVIFWLFMNRSYYGKYCCILGENLDLARKNGMRCTQISIIISEVASLYLAAATILLIGYTGNGGIALGESYLYIVLACVILGRVLLHKGEHTLPGMLLGILIMILCTYLLTVYGLLNNWEVILEGIVILSVFFLEGKRSEHYPPESEKPLLEDDTSLR